ncbi:fused MFS/spermidine synthase [Georgenia sp. TF02-10]|uniref:spermidine synthase n=1 Tax=Georgenia sp. TF02-10 TaxID=2917725 RepID=UPI001FA80B9B|nr:fused MFS/spermidine synthase [Georgenia sp. TF02-10]UNX55968.1 fused MFS/spermidine synthase [Georgenia sp. TF02-10]
MPDRPRHRPARPAAAAGTAAALPRSPVPTSLGVARLRREPGEPHRVTLFLDGMESSHLDLADPAHLEFEYMQQMSVVLDAARPAGPVRAVHLGAAGCALARAWAARRPGSTQLAVELDERLAALVREWFDLPRAPRLRIRVGDARAVVATLAEGAWDVVVRDVFDHAEVPPHVRTLAAAEQVRRVLAPDGLYLVNLTDEPPLRQARAEAATLAAVFADVAVIAEPAVLRGRRFGNVVLAASSAPLPMGRVERDLRALPLPARALHGEALAAFCGTTPVLLDPADDAAPA